MGQTPEPGRAARQLKALRERLDISLADCARVMGYAHTSGYQRVEQAKWPFMPLDKLLLIAPLLMQRGATADEVADIGGVPPEAILGSAPGNASPAIAESTREAGSDLNWPDLLEAYTALQRAKRAGLYAPASDEEEAAKFRHYYELAVTERKGKG